jgi:hypothetical protein
MCTGGYGRRRGLTGARTTLLVGAFKSAVPKCGQLWRTIAPALVFCTILANLTVCCECCERTTWSHGCDFGITRTCKCCGPLRPFFALTASSVLPVRKAIVSLSIRFGVSPSLLIKILFQNIESQLLRARDGRTVTVNSPLACARSQQLPDFYSRTSHPIPLLGFFLTLPEPCTI